MTTLLQAINAAQPGDVIDWSGKPPVAGLKSARKAVTIRNVVFAGGARILGCFDLTIEDYSCDLRGAMADTRNVLGVEACRNITLRRGRITAESRKGRGLLISRGDGGIVVDGLTVSGMARGVYIDDIADVTVKNLLVDGVSSDGINISRAHRVTIDGVEVRDIDIGDSTAHPDVVQIINSPTNPGTCSDIVIRNLKAKTRAQGVNLFDHGRGGADRITVENVDLLTNYHHGMTLENVRGLVLRNIRVGALPGTDPKIKPWVKTTGSTDVVAENVVMGWDGSEPAKLSPFSDEQEARIRAIVREARQ